MYSLKNSRVIFGYELYSHDICIIYISKAVTCQIVVPYVQKPIRSQKITYTTETLKYTFPQYILDNSNKGNLSSVFTVVSTVKCMTNVLLLFISVKIRSIVLFVQGCIHIKDVMQRTWKKKFNINFLLHVYILIQHIKRVIQGIKWDFSLSLETPKNKYILVCKIRNLYYGGICTRIYGQQIYVQQL
eukprot:TRINITY_DN1449_c1_g2_i1.p3 TRINITY_DN1449_c1_g2~~TRINITY_DN1449_c1_g2_i1.p3  ORF type:complete len:187 (-),score=-20.01 TRINITY_DN1449_c1_g2_i1:365-925(-)